MKRAYPQPKVHTSTKVDIRLGVLIIQRTLNRSNPSASAFTKIMLKQNNLPSAKPTS